MNAIEISHVSKAFGDVIAVDDLSFAIAKASVFGLLGPNGAGKTTTIRMLMNIIGPDDGRIAIFGQPNTDGVLDRVGYLPEERGLYPKMIVRELLELFGVLKGLSRTDSQGNIDPWLQRFGLAEWRDKRVEQLSRGMQQKVMFIGTVLHEPDLIVLDEPFSGLDPVSTSDVKDVILEQKNRGTTIILSTHLMEQVEKLCDEICLINEGRSVLSGKVPEVKRRFGVENVVLEYDGQAKFLRDPSLVADFNDYGHYVEIRPAAGVLPEHILKRAVGEVAVRRFEVREPSLNQIFIDVVKNEDTEGRS